MSAKSVHQRAIENKPSRPDLLIVGLASILDGVVILITLGSVITTLRSKASLRAARRLSMRQWWD